MSRLWFVFALVLPAISVRLDDDYSSFSEIPGPVEDAHLSGDYSEAELPSDASLVQAAQSDYGNLDNGGTLSSNADYQDPGAALGSLVQASSGDYSSAGNSARDYSSSESSCGDYADGAGEAAADTSAGGSDEDGVSDVAEQGDRLGSSSTDDSADYDVPADNQLDAASTGGLLEDPGAAAGPENGDAKCPCVPVDLKQFEVPGGIKVAVGGTAVVYPAGLGAQCRAWDDGRYPESCTSSGAPWCAEKWCYVDPCKCALEVLPKASTYLLDARYDGKPLYYSYATCGGQDTFSSAPTPKEQLNQLCGWTTTQPPTTLSTTPTTTTTLATTTESPEIKVQAAEKEERQVQLGHIDDGTAKRIRKMQERHARDLAAAKRDTREATEADEAVSKQAKDKIGEIQRESEKLEADSRSAANADRAHFADMKADARWRDQKAARDIYLEDKYDQSKDQADREVQESRDAAMKMNDEATRQIARLSMKANDLKEENDIVKDESAETIRKSQAKNSREIQKSKDTLDGAVDNAEQQKALAQKKVEDADTEMQIADKFGDKDIDKAKRRGRDNVANQLRKESSIRLENADKIKGAFYDTEDAVQEDMEDSNDRVRDAVNSAEEDTGRAVKRQQDAELESAEAVTSAREDQKGAMRENELTLNSAREDADAAARRAADEIDSTQERVLNAQKHRVNVEASAEAASATIHKEVSDAKSAVREANQQVSDSEEEAIESEKKQHQAEVDATEKISGANQDAATKVSAEQDKLDFEKEKEDEASAKETSAASEAQSAVMQVSRAAKEEVATSKEANAAKLAEIRGRLTAEKRKTEEKEHESLRQATMKVEKAQSGADALVTEARQKAERDVKAKQDQAMEDTRSANAAEADLDRAKTQTDEELSATKEDNEKEVEHAKSVSDTETKKAKGLESHAKLEISKAKKDQSTTDMTLKEKADVNEKKLDQAKGLEEREEKQVAVKDVQAVGVEKEKKKAELSEEKAEHDLLATEAETRQKVEDQKHKAEQEERAADQEERFSSDEVAQQRRADSADMRIVKQADQKRMRNAKFQLEKQATRLREEEAKVTNEEHSAEEKMRQMQDEERKKSEEMAKQARDQQEEDAKKSAELAEKTHEEETKIKQNGKEESEQVADELGRELKTQKVKLEKETKRFEHEQDEAQAAKHEVDQNVREVKAQDDKAITDIKAQAVTQREEVAQKAAADADAAKEKLERVKEAGNKEIRDDEDFHKEQMARLHEEIVQAGKRHQRTEAEIAKVKKRAAVDIAKARRAGAKAVRRAMRKHEAEKKERAQEENIADSEEEQVNKAWQTAQVQAATDARNDMPSEDTAAENAGNGDADGAES
eukprot:TRINITY_DN44044_c0_g1_i1.p1 TRINITY_DN44044_c0_g1~~TRINITY_DN44044_c0_g1_i1.p1  ORF type:complete len:1348 (-),score=494.20 TRINITY_DN44044_c0_g1_i1:138-4181(-)